MTDIWNIDFQCRIWQTGRPEFGVRVSFFFFLKYNCIYLFRYIYIYIYIYIVYLRRFVQIDANTNRFVTLGETV